MDEIEEAEWYKERNQLQVKEILNTQLIKAAGHNILLEVQRLIEEGASDYQGALVSACIGGHFRIVKLLVGIGIDIYDQEALVSACEGGNSEIVNLFIGLGADIIHAKNDDGVDAITIALMKNNVEVVKILINAGAKVTDELFKNVIEECENDVVSLLIDSGYSSLQALTMAIYYGNHDNIKKLIDLGVNVNEVSEDQINRLSTHHEFERLELLLNNGLKMTDSMVEWFIGETYYESDESENNEAVNRIMKLIKQTQRQHIKPAR